MGPSSMPASSQKNPGNCFFGSMGDGTGRNTFFFFYREFFFSPFAYGGTDGPMIHKNCLQLNSHFAWLDLSVVWAMSAGLHTDGEMGLGAGVGPHPARQRGGPGTCSGLGARADGLLRQPCQLPLWASPSPRQEPECGQEAGVGLGRASLPSTDLASAGCPGCGGNEDGDSAGNYPSRPCQTLGLGPRTGRRVVGQCKP